MARYQREISGLGAAVAVVLILAIYAAIWFGLIAGALLLVRAIFF